MAMYPVGNGKFVEVDEEDIVAISFYAWHINKDGSGNKYVRAKINNKMIYLHKFIAKRMGLNILKQIDHKNRNKLNCKRNNLREATRTQQCSNTTKYKNNTTGYKGVSFKKETNKYVARIMINNKAIHLGYFDNLYKAKEAYNDAAVKYFDDFACIG